MPTIEPLCLPHGLNCYSQLKHDRSIHCDQQHNALSSTDKSLEMQKIALNRWLRLRTLATMIQSLDSRQFPRRLFLFCPLLCSDVPLLADCCFMYYLLGQPQIKLSRVSPFFCHPPTATSHATPGEEPWMSNVAFFSANVRDISAYSV